jgi:hypothetical protein
VLWGETKNLAFEDKKGKFLRNDFSTAKSCKTSCTWKTKAKQEITNNNFISLDMLNALNSAERILKNCYDVDTLYTARTPEYTKDKM